METCSKNTNSLDVGSTFLFDDFSLR